MDHKDHDWVINHGRRHKHTQHDGEKNASAKKNDTHIPLNRVPGIGDFGILFVWLDGCHHLSVHPLIHLWSKDVPQDPADQHDDKDDEEDDKEDEEHASDLPIRAQGPQEGDDGHHEPSRDQDGSGCHVKITAQQSFHERLVWQSPYADRKDDQATRLCPQHMFLRHLLTGKGMLEKSWGCDWQGMSRGRRRADRNRIWWKKVKETRKQQQNRALIEITSTRVRQSPDVYRSSQLMDFQKYEK